MKKKVLLVLIVIATFTPSKAQLISAGKTGFNLARGTIVVDQNDFPLVKKAAELLQQDIEAVTGKKIPIHSSLHNTAKNQIIIGSIERSSLIKTLLNKKKIPAPSIKMPIP